MGSAQSKAPEQTSEEKLLERLRMIRLQDAGSTGDYISVDRGDPPAYSPRITSLSISAAEQWEKELLEDPKNRLALAALSSNAANDVLRSRAVTISDAQNFNIKIPFEGSPVTNQRSSGRCWLFAATNVFRVAIMQRYKLKEFELSQAYLFFWDKLEKANYFLENVLETVEEPLDGRLVQELLSSPVGDGGQWDMVANLVQKYGLIPQSLYPDSFNAMNSSAMNGLITSKLREDGIRLRAMSQSKDPSVRSSISATKDTMLREIHLILTVMLGPPPSPTATFTWEYHDKDGAFQSLKATPKDFSKQLSDSKAVRACAGTDVHKLFSLVNDPRNEYGRLLTVNRLGNVHGGRPITYVNVDMATMKAAVVKMIQRGIPVFFGSDVGKYSDSRKGIMDTALYDYELGFNVQLGLTKAERLMTRESAMTHAMVLTGVHVVEGKAVRWRVENSWSETAGEKGYFVMSDAWMNEFVYQAVVDPAFVSEEVKKVLGQTPKVLNLWDPMGALA
ncbi:bleomycin hydrolase [Eremomyces bilateralis CBS 781.70]|uniref:Cysteine proteinase 1, mitochondrial n=1 Tax=Eremomyces bilateralis CBS 781.70 TaxID=1392243 RepID=A0A6G1G6I4_9PEZI|nr:bleomycin hydrolase [Eremomyces bilateralis CBS 781.70]KAF1813632.1 bleomycin hydrolase [Eremomyces bilateralis CBS 781.70]